LARGEETKIEIGINDIGELFLGDDSSGGNYRDTLGNRERLKCNFLRYTGKEAEF
jgi:hypothetical protein